MSDERPPSVRSAARAKMPLDGADAQALEGALQQAEKELWRTRAELEAANARVARLDSELRGTRNTLDAARADVSRMREALERLGEGPVTQASQDTRRRVAEMTSKWPVGAESARPLAGRVARHLEDLPEPAPTTCPTCGGSGAIDTGDGDFRGMPPQTRPCPDCSGRST
jgi:chromosome segregation ATPase